MWAVQFCPCAVQEESLYTGLFSSEIMPKIVALRHNATAHRKERTQFLIYLDEELLNDTDLKAGDQLDCIKAGKHEFTVRKARQ